MNDLVRRVQCQLAAEEACLAEATTERAKLIYEARRQATKEILAQIEAWGLNDDGQALGGEQRGHCSQPK